MLNSKLQVLLVLLCLATTLSSCPFIVLLTAKAELLQGSVPLIYEVDSAFSGRLTQTIKVENPSSESVNDGRLYVPIINNETARHYATIFNMTSSGGNPRFLNDDSGNTYAYWQGITIEPGETFIARMQYYLVSFETRILIDKTRIVNYDKDTDLYKKFTQPEEFVESDALEIISKAQSLTQDVSNIHDKVSRVYDFVVSSLHYATQEDEKGALWALRNRTGDCSEYSYLFVALCRAAGIPARIQTGFSFHSLAEKTVDGHMWAEYYLPNYEWVPVDPTWQLFDKIDEKHFSSMKSMPKIIPYANYFFNCTQGPHNVTDTQEVLLEPSSMNLFGNNLVADALQTVRTINQARLAITVERLFGMPMIFQSEAAQVDQAYMTSETSLQSALRSWTENLTATRSLISEAQAEANEASQKAWMLVASAFAILIGTLIAVLSIASVLIRRNRTKSARQLPPAKTSEVSSRVSSFPESQEDSISHIDRHSVRYQQFQTEFR